MRWGRVTKMWGKKHKVGWVRWDFKALQEESVSNQSQSRIQGFGDRQPVWFRLRLVQAANSILHENTFNFTSSYITMTRQYLEVGRLSLVHGEPHENSELQVIGKRLSARQKKNVMFQESTKVSKLPNVNPTKLLSQLQYFKVQNLGSFKKYCGDNSSQRHNW